MKKMKSSIQTILIVAVAVAVYSCTDIQGDGIDTIEYTGSEVPENTSYRNPVWDFDLTNASVFLSSGPFYALGEEKEWAEGVSYTVPVLTSANLMNWSLIEQGEAFISRPSWAEGNITSVTGLFSKSLGMYYVFYKIGDAGIGAADARTPQGPYKDYGKITDKTALGAAEIVDPFVYALGSTYYLFYIIPDDGVYGVKLSLVKNVKPQVNGTPFKIAGPGYAGIFVRKKGVSFWFYGTHSGNIIIAKSGNIEGPYADKSGSALTEGGIGEVVVSPGADFSVIGQVSGIQMDNEDNDWLLYTAVDSEIPQLPTGESRYVLMLNRLPIGDDGWPSEVVTAESGYFSPRFKN
jgi:arabinan endo-1,5-alpha-L-arabinosidase